MVEMTRIRILIVQLTFEVTFWKDNGHLRGAALAGTLAEQASHINVMFVSGKTRTGDVSHMACAVGSCFLKTWALLGHSWGIRSGDSWLWCLKPLTKGTKGTLYKDSWSFCEERSKTAPKCFQKVPPSKILQSIHTIYTKIKKKNLKDGPPANQQIQQTRQIKQILCEILFFQNFLMGWMLRTIPNDNTICLSSQQNCSKIFCFLTSL